MFSIDFKAFVDSSLFKLETSITNRSISGQAFTLGPVCSSGCSHCSQCPKLVRLARRATPFNYVKSCCKTAVSAAKYRKNTSFFPRKRVRDNCVFHRRQLGRPEPRKCDYIETSCAQAGSTGTQTMSVNDTSRGNQCETGSCLGDTDACDYDNVRYNKTGGMFFWSNIGHFSGTRNHQQM